MPTTAFAAPTGVLPSSSPRDLAVDALRAAAVGVVVVGHAIVAVARLAARTAHNRALTVS